MLSAAKYIDRLLLAFGMLVVAMGLQVVTLASQGYALTLLVALLLAAGADALLAFVALRGGTGFRIAAIVLVLPSLLILADFIRRTPSARFSHDHAPLPLASIHLANAVRGGGGAGHPCSYREGVSRDSGGGGNCGCLRGHVVCERLVPLGIAYAMRGNRSRSSARLSSRPALTAGR